MAGHRPYRRWARSPRSPRLLPECRARPASFSKSTTGISGVSTSSRHPGSASLAGIPGQDPRPASPAGIPGQVSRVGHSGCCASGVARPGLAIAGRGLVADPPRAGAPGQIRPLVDAIPVPQDQLNRTFSHMNTTFSCVQMILRRASFYLRYMSEHDQQPFTVEGTVKLDAAAAAAQAEAEATSMLVPFRTASALSGTPSAGTAPTGTGHQWRVVLHADAAARVPGHAA